MSTLTQATSGQLRQITRVGTDALEKAIVDFGLSKGGAQHVHARGGIFAEAIRLAVITTLKDLSASDRYKDEEVQSTKSYPRAYKLMQVAEQINCLRVHFPELGTADLEIVNQQLPPNAEGWFAIPRWEKVGRTYSEAVDRVLAMIGKTRGEMWSHNGGRFDSNKLRHCGRTQEMMEKLYDQQVGQDILILPAQFGVLHRGRSVRRAHDVFTNREFALTAFMAGITVLTHPERFQLHEGLWIDCSGDNYDDPDTSAWLVNAPPFPFSGCYVHFSHRSVKDVSYSSGVASGFLL